MDTDYTLPQKSFAQVASATLPSIPRSHHQNSASIFDSSGDPERGPPFKRRSILSSGNVMPVQTSPPTIPDSFPSFMSVFGGISPKVPEKEEDHALNHSREPHTHGSANASKHLPFQHHESVSSVTTGSAESSPTTTVSTFDSPSAPETSPSSSPESPLSMSLSYPKFKPPARNIECQSLSAVQYNPPRRASDEPIHQRPDSPGRRGRNLKNLSLKMPPPSQTRPPIATASVVETTSRHHLSAPPSPMHIPPKSSRRKPANLTIRTPAFGKSFSTSITEVAPPTPNGQHSLRHAESSPSLSVFSPSFGPKGGMQLPRPVTHHGSRRSSEGNLSQQTASDEGKLAGGVLHELAEEDDVPDSRESTRRNDRGYPNGPIRIYDSGVFLYLEPTAREASDFDVVINVAEEVVNPFNNSNTKNDTVMSAWRNSSINTKRFSGAEPQTAVSEASFKSAFESPQAETPTASGSGQSGPEYVHVNWGHNSEILDDLYPLCELIDSRVSQGRKVLIHCQLGVSRSASLVIAYGLYKYRDMDFNSVYGVVKDRSQWVGPNMSLIYQLTDFRSRLLRGSPSKPAPDEWFVRGPRRSSEPQRPSGVGRPAGCKTGESGNLSTAAQASSSSLSVPSTNPSAPFSREARGFSQSLSHKRSLSPRPLPLGQRLRPIEPRCRHLKSESNLRRRDGGNSVRTEIFVRDKPEALPDLFSPRTNGFLANGPGSPNLLDEGPSGLGFGPRMMDPRSPPPGSERLIMRNIDEVL